MIRGGDVLEAASQVNTVVFDKTGTLTQGKPCLQQVLPTPGGHLSAAHLLTFAAAVERCTTHPVAQAIVQAADGSGELQVQSTKLVTAIGKFATVLVHLVIVVILL